jgi:hypothetical protein
LNSSESKEVILAHGNANVTATHETTIEITKEKALSRKGDCIIAVGADRAVQDLDHSFKEKLRKDDAKISILIEVGGVTESVKARGNSRLLLNHPRDIVVRKSGFICSRTLAIHADKSANDLSRELVKKMQDPEQEVKVTLVLES